jgi:hypothetical protein
MTPCMNTQQIKQSYATSKRLQPSEIQNSQFNVNKFRVLETVNQDSYLYQQCFPSGTGTQTIKP